MENATANDKDNARCARYRAAHPERRLESQRAYLRRVRGPPAYTEANRKINRKKRYGVSEDLFERMNAEQDGVCCLCGEPEIRRVRGALVPLSVDHDHRTGKLRRLLCHRCNLALGLMRDRPVLLEKAAAYLRQFEDHAMFPQETKVVPDELTCAPTDLGGNNGR